MELKHLHKAIKLEDTRISELKTQIKELPTQEYYKVFANEMSLNRDLNTLKTLLKEALNRRYKYLENLRLEVNKQLNYTSQQQKLMVA